MCGVRGTKRLQSSIDTIRHQEEAVLSDTHYDEAAVADDDATTAKETEVEAGTPIVEVVGVAIGNTPTDIASNTLITEATQIDGQTTFVTARDSYGGVKMFHQYPYSPPNNQE